MKIAAKETDETMYWLELCEGVGTYQSVNTLLNESASILKVLSKIIASSKKS